MSQAPVRASICCCLIIGTAIVFMGTNGCDDRRPANSVASLATAPMLPAEPTGQEVAAFMKQITEDTDADRLSDSYLESLWPYLQHRDSSVAEFVMVTLEAAHKRSGALSDGMRSKIETEAIARLMSEDPRLHRAATHAVVELQLLDRPGVKDRLLRLIPTNPQVESILSARGIELK